MIFLNILKKINNNNNFSFISNKKIKTLVELHQKDKKRIQFLRSKLKYGKVLFQLEYHYYKNKYLINTVYKLVFINQVTDSFNKYSTQNILEHISIKRDI
jgi:hypothetical protein